MKRSSKIIEAPSDTAALKYEIGNIKAKLTESIKTINVQNKNLEGLRLKNFEFAKNAEVSNVMIRSQSDRIAELSRDCLIAKANYLKLKTKFEDITAISFELRRTFVSGSNHILKLSNILEEQTDSDLTLGIIDPANSLSSSTTGTTSKSNVEMKVLPTISGHTIQKPTISLSKSDSQQINFLLQHQHDTNGSHFINSSHNNIDNISETTNTLGNVTNIEDENSIEDVNNQPNTLNGDLHSSENENLSEEIENADETLRHNRLSTVMEVTHESLANVNINIISNNLFTRNTSVSTNSTTSSSISYNRSKKRASIMPSPIDTSAKIRRASCQPNNQTGIGSFIDQNTTKRSTSSISTRASNSLIHSAISEDPLEGPSTLLDKDNELLLSKSANNEDGQPMETSTPMDTDRRIRTRSSNIVPVLTEFITTRKTKSNTKTYLRSDQKLNSSKSLNDLKDIDETNKHTKSTTPRRRTRNRKLSTSLTDLSEQNKSVEIQNKSLSPEKKIVDNSTEECTPKRTITNKKGRPKKKMTVVKNIPSSVVKPIRKSRSYSPNYRLHHKDKDPAVIPTDSTNPTVQLVRLLDPLQHNNRNKRRSRSFSPARSETSDKSDGSEISTRSSRRTKTPVNYNEPSLKTKVRRK